MKKKHLKHAEKALELLDKAVDHINELYDDLPYCDATPEEKKVLTSVMSLRENLIFDRQSMTHIVNNIKEQI